MFMPPYRVLRPSSRRSGWQCQSSVSSLPISLNTFSITINQRIYLFSNATSFQSPLQSMDGYLCCLGGSGNWMHIQTSFAPPRQTRPQQPLMEHRGTVASHPSSGGWLLASHLSTLRLRWNWPPQKIAFQSWIGGSPNLVLADFDQTRRSRWAR